MDYDDGEICGEEYVSKDGVCTNDPKYADGKCGFHSDEVERTEAQKGNNEKHGIFKSGYYKSLPDRDKNFIDAVADDLLEKSYYTVDDPSMVEKCRQIAIDLHQKRRADEYVAKEGLTQEKTVGVHEEYGEFTETEENVLFITKDRLSRESRLSMKDLGIFDEDNNQKTQQAAESLIESLSSDIE